MTTRRSFLACAAALPWTARAQSDDDWPNRPVKIMVGFPPGQTSDVIARLLADELSTALHQAFVVENRPGAGATLAAGLVAKAPRDGYTVLFSSSGPLTVAPTLYHNLNYDSATEIDPIAFCGWSPLVLVVPADSPYKSVPEVVAASKAGTKLFYGSGGNGVTNHLAMEMFKQMSGATFTHVPYKGAAPAITDLLGNNIQLMFETATPTVPLINSGKLRALGVSTPKRYPELATVPTIGETYPGYDAVPWAGFCVPAGTPARIKDRFESTLMRIVDRPDVRQKMLQSGFVADYMGSQKSRQFTTSETAKWKEVIQTADIHLD